MMKRNGERKHNTNQKVEIPFLKKGRREKKSINSVMKKYKGVVTKEKVKVPAIKLSNLRMVNLCTRQGH